MAAAFKHANNNFIKEPYHTSALTGEGSWSYYWAIQNGFDVNSLYTIMYSISLLKL
jgi:hypothetical protein